MGRDKALLEWNSHAVVEDVAARVQNVAGNVALVGRPERYAALGFECLSDLRPGLGPLAGIEAALESGRAELNLIVACDMPGIETEWLRKLLRQAEQSGAFCSVLRDGGGIVHPLCGVYRTECLPEVRRALDEGCLKVHDLVHDLRGEFLDVKGPAPNVNTPEDWLAFEG
jgi:molybdopterin-guanine dinucleotide biosynthesis protein A